MTAPMTREELLAERKILVREIDAACGYLLNAKIDLETGCTKATAIKTIEGGLKRLRGVLSDLGERTEVEARPAAPEV